LLRPADGKAGYSVSPERRETEMAASTADTICQSGVPYPVAIEIARQMAAGAGGVDSTSVNKLVASGVPGAAATALVAQITAQVFSAEKLVAAGIHGETAVQIKKTSGH
jgi:hypothetical protein